MHFVRNLRLIRTFYAGFFLPSLLVTAGCIRSFWLYGWAGFSAVFWCKVLTLALLYFFVNEYRKKEYYYYQNLGISKTMLWAASLSLDVMLFILLLIISNLLR